MKIALDPPKRKTWGIPWTSCKPFIENSRAVLVHRPRRVTTHKIGDRWASHIAIECWCNNGMTGTKKFTFLNAPGHSQIVCGRCEDKAVSSGLPSSSTLAGRHVHTGGVVAVMRCCKGWLCQRCLRVNAPFMPYCSCRPPDAIATGTTVAVCNCHQNKEQLTAWFCPAHGNQT
jgi:hypothetical protein